MVITGFEEELVDEDDEDADVDEVELENWTQKVKNWWDFGADGERALQRTASCHCISHHEHAPQTCCRC